MRTPDRGELNGQKPGDGAVGGINRRFPVGTTGRRYHYDIISRADLFDANGRGYYIVRASKRTLQ
jgi:hypothetical protein